MFDLIFNPEWWAAQVSALARALLPFVLAAFRSGYGSAAAAIGVSLDLSNEAAEAFARQYAFQRAGMITLTTRAYLQQTFGDWIASGAPLSELEATLIQSGYFSENRANIIAVTETTQIFAEANIQAWRESGVVTAKVWMTAQDDLVCPICEPLSGTTVALEANGFTTEVGDLGLFAPPAHARCRCWLKPVTQ